jgi:hypothetical protein
MRKFRLKKKFRDGSIAPQDFEARKLFHGSVIHEYAEPTEFVLDMVEGGYMEEVLDEEVTTTQKKRGRPSGKHTTD